jgi:hypothetical protein
MQSVSGNTVRTCSNDQLPKERRKPWAGCREHKLFAAMYIMEQSTASRTVSGVGLSAEHGSNLHIWNRDRFFTIPTHGLLEIKLGFSIENLEWILMPPPSKISRWFSRGQKSVERKARTLSRWSVARTEDAAKQRILIPPRDPCPMLCSRRRLRPSSQHHSLGLLLGVALGIVLRWSLFKPSVFWWLSAGFLLSQVGPVLPECVRSSGWQVSFSVQFSTFLKNSTWLFSSLHASLSSWLDVQKSLVWLNDLLSQVWDPFCEDVNECVFQSLLLQKFGLYILFLHCTITIFWFWKKMSCWKIEGCGHHYFMFLWLICGKEQKICGLKYSISGLCIDESKEKYVCLIVEVSVAWILSPFVFQFSGMLSP